MTIPPVHNAEPLRALAASRWRIAITLTVVMIATYFGFIALIAWRRDLLSRLIAPGLSVGIVLGALVIVVAWLLTWIYVRWCNRHYDAQLEAMR
ncbi:MAG: putative rane protein clustering with ActP [Gemmatimonadetes bacterium]|nr:putative rane protein clustering with ActP [Gemmatimonadota bacterium]